MARGRYPSENPTRVDDPPAADTTPTDAPTDDP